LDNISSGIAKRGAIRVDARGAWRAKCCRIKPLESRRVTDRNRLPRNGVCAKRSAYAPPDIDSPAQHARREIQPGSNRKVAAPLPSSQNMVPSTLSCKTAVFSERQVVSPVSCEFVPLVKAGEPAVRGNVERILRHNASPGPDRRRHGQGRRTP